MRFLFYATILSDELQDELHDFFFSLAISTNHKVVVAGVITRSLGEFFNIVLTHLVHLHNGLESLFFCQILLAHNAFDAIRHCGLDKRYSGG